MAELFKTRKPAVLGNGLVRIPQQEAFQALTSAAEAGDREVGVILPVGCGKSGCIALAPFAFKAKRALVVAPGITIANQLQSDFDPANPDMFYQKTAVLDGAPYPEPVEIRGTTTNIGDLEEAEVVVTNIQQFQGQENKWLKKLSADFFDLILFDEGHHNVAESWDLLKQKFPNARIVNFSATPLRADGQLMSGRIIYSFPVARAIQEGYVKRLKAVVLNPRTLRYVRRQDGAEIDVSLEEVRRLGEEDADFRRSIVTSKETLNTIVDASIRELQKLREAAGSKRLKIIASALNFVHCGQIVEAYRARGLRADYVHSREEGDANKRVLKRLESDELDVIVQVRKLGEGFDHRYLAVAAVFSVFSNLSPFVQFVGRIMRVIKQNAPNDGINRGVVVFHAGANVARRWQDFQSYSEADQEFFDQLLPMEGLDFGSATELEVEPSPGGAQIRELPEIRSQSGLQLEEIPLIQDDPEALAALQLLKQKGFTPDQVRSAYEDLRPVPTTKARERQAKRGELDTRVKTAAMKLLAQRDIKADGKTLDKKRLGKTNFVVVKSAIDREISERVKHKSGERHEYTREELDLIDREFSDILATVSRDVFHG